MKSSCLFLLIFGVIVDNHCWNLLFIKVLKESPFDNIMFICTLRCHLSFNYLHTPVIESFIMYLNKCKYLVFMTTQFIILKYIWGKRKIIREEKTLILFMTIHRTQNIYFLYFVWLCNIYTTVFLVKRLKHRT
jgi:hypothetical protein